MNAPDTLTALRQGKITSSESGLVAWEMIRTLVGFDTTSRESNLALIDWIRAYLESHGADCLLKRCRHFHRHPFGRLVADVDADLDTREVHVRKQ